MAFEATPLQVMQSLDNIAWSPSDGANARIQTWLNAIAATYPEMESYCHAAGPGYFSWCGLAVAHCMAAAGIRPVFGPSDTDKFLWALAWLEFGDKVTSPQPGDVLVFNFGGGDHHVTLFESQAGNGRWNCHGGNQSHKVRLSNFAASQCMGIRRPSARRPVVTPPASVSSGKAGVYGWFDGNTSWRDNSDAPGSAALGVADNRQGHAFYSHETLGKWFYVTDPQGKTALSQQTDIGPAPRTGRSIDIHARVADALGYTQPNFPTNSVWQWSPAQPPTGTENLTAKQQADAYTRVQLTDGPAPPDRTLVGLLEQRIEQLEKMISTLIAAPSSMQPQTDLAALLQQLSNVIDVQSPLGLPAIQDQIKKFASTRSINP